MAAGIWGGSGLLRCAGKIDFYCICRCVHPGVQPRLGTGLFHHKNRREKSRKGPEIRRNPSQYEGLSSLYHWAGVHWSYIGVRRVMALSLLSVTPFFLSMPEVLKAQGDAVLTVQMTPLPFPRQRDGPCGLLDAWFSPGSTGGEREVKTGLLSSSRKEIGQKQSNVAWQRGGACSVR